MISIEKVSKKFTSRGQEVKALDEVSLTINDGDIFGIIGFSGAGKSTLLRMINALEKPESGSVTVNNVEVSSLSYRALRPVRHEIGMIFQQFNLLNTRTVYENIALPCIMAHQNRQEVKRKVSDLLSYVGLADKAQSYPDQLSGGQKQRVGIARALATSPSILLCDEATSALDPDTSSSILQLLRKINRELEITIVFVTHDINVIKKICNKVAVMESGRVIEQGDVVEVFSNPQHALTRKFVATVIPEDIPENLQKTLKAETAPCSLIKIRLADRQTTRPLIWEINKRFDVCSNVLFASVTEIGGIVLSVMIIRYSGDPEVIKKVKDFFTKNSIDWQELTL
ncbi:MAG: ATP-binding cassette domain-containing protein [Succinivibrio sp.]|nr:ATP-binding cassette domain-containing protein [Succinivibrio sp.]